MVVVLVKNNMRESSVDARKVKGVHDGRDARRQTLTQITWYFLLTGFGLLV